MAGGDLLEIRHAFGAFVARVRAAGAEGAAARRVQRARDIAGEHDALVGAGDLRIRDRDGGQKRLGIRVQGMVIDLVGVGQLDHLAEVHDGDAVGDMAHDQQIVGDEQIGQAEFFLQLGEHVDDLRLDRHVQRGDRLVADDEVRVDRERAGDADALALAAGKFVGVAGGMLGVEADIAHELENALLPFLPAGVELMHVQRLADDVGDGHAGVEGGIGILEDHGGLVAEGLDIGLGLDLPALVEDFAAGGLVQVQDGAADGRLAAAGSTQQGDEFPLINLQINSL